MIVTNLVRNIAAAVMAALIITLLATLLLYRGAVHERNDLRKQTTELTAAVESERAWSAQLSAELADRRNKQTQSDKQTDAATEKLDKSYAENPDWSRAPVPDDVGNGLRDFLQTR